MRRTNTAATAARRVAAGLGAVVALAVAAAPAQAATVPAWDLGLSAAPTNLVPGSTGDVVVQSFNVGSAATDGTAIALTVRLPDGVAHVDDPFDRCTGVGQLVTCTTTTAVGLDGYVRAIVPVAVDAGAAVGPADVTATIEGGGAETQELTQAVRIDPQPARFGIDSFSATVLDEEGRVETRAGVRPWSAVTEFTFNAIEDPVQGRAPVENVQRIDTELPAGFAGNAALMPRCSAADFYAPSPGSGAQSIGCPPETKVGAAMVSVTLQGVPKGSDQVSGVYNMTPPRGYAAMFGFKVVQSPVTVLVRLRSDGDYGLTASLRDVSNSVGVVSSRLTLFGVPTDPRRNPAATTQVPYLSNPFDCSAGPLATGLSVGSWQDRDEWVHVEDVAPAVTGCDQLDFRPSIAITPETTKSDSATGLSVDLGIAQEIAADRLMAAPLKDAVVTLPQGVSINPSAAGGLQACSDEQFGRTTLGSENCPTASRIGSLAIDTPLLGGQLTGDVYVARQLSGDPLSGRMFRIFMQASGSGVTVKLEGAVRADPLSGQLTASFLDNPQVPFSHLRLTFKGGERALLATPAQCGPATTNAAFLSWGGQQQTLSSSFDVSFDGAGAPCPAALPFAPAFAAGTTNPLAGALTPFTLALAREDNTQALSALKVGLPAGLLGYISRVEQCAAAAAAAGTCGEGSRVGGVQVEAGAGARPFALPGRVYLTGGYRGAPYGLSIVVPAQAGPFDLGEVVVRAAIHVDRTTAALTVDSDPFPQVVKGVPLRMRSIALAIDRGGFMFNPTSCLPAQVRGIVAGAGGASAIVDKRFQVSGCRALPFAPRLSLRVGGRGKTTRQKKSPLTAIATQGPGQAAMRSVRVTLPLSLAANLRPLQNGCPLATYEAGACAPSTQIGSASVTTPVLPGGLAGGAWFVRYPGERLPRIVVPLRGAVAIDLVARVRVTRRLQLETTFGAVPDVPISQFKLALRGDANAPLNVVKDLCARKSYAGVAFAAHNGRGLNRNLRLTVDGCKKPAKKKVAKKATRKVTKARSRR
ncbi:MAG TPA: hypothetical protein VLK58_04860 [Conexibacter sp.]|nr:hypothetical protein [Conexibacter sp.]